MMVRLVKIRIKGYRSIRDETEVNLPRNMPLVFVGENNAGKSNIVRALDLILGEFWPGTQEPDDHMFWGRDPRSGPIEIQVFWDGLSKVDGYGRSIAIDSIMWRYDPNAPGSACYFRAYSAGGAEQYVTKEMREQCMCVVVGADRRLSYQLSYSSKWTLLSKLMRKFHQHLTSDQGRVERLKDQFDEVKQIFNEVDEFRVFQQGLADQFGTMLRGMTYGLQVDFSAYDPSNYFHSLRVLPQEENQPRTFEELGSGQEQVLALVFAHAYAKAFYGGIILVIEEPEAHLHPLAQQWLARKIQEMARDGLQIIITTHSPAFVDMLGLEGIVLVRKEGGATVVRQLTSAQLSDFCVRYGANTARTNADTILPFYASCATQDILSGLFAKKVVLVEGPTEQLALPIYLEKTGLDVVKEGISIIPVMGKGNLAKWWRLFRAYGIPVFLTFDNDTSDDTDGEKRQDALRTIGIQESDFGFLTTTPDWIIGDSFCIFGEDFEHTMRTTFPLYSDLEETARSELGGAKPLVARYVAERLELATDSAGWKSFNELKTKIESLDNVTPEEASADGDEAVSPVPPDEEEIPF